MIEFTYFELKNKLSNKQIYFPHVFNVCIVKITKHKFHSVKYVLVGLIYLNLTQSLYF